MIPYDEAFQKQRVGPTLAGDYVEAHRVVGDDDSWVVWPARVQYDACAGMSPEGSLSKHRAEWRHALGLDPHPQPPSGDSPVLGIAGQFFTRNGQAATLIQCSDFNLLHRYQDGEDIITILSQRRACGFNDLRVWTAFDVSGIGTFTNIDYSSVPAFLALCGSYSFTVELTAFTGPYPFFANDDAKVSHWDSLKSVCAGISNVRLERVNEGDHPANKDLPFSRLTRPSGVLASGGSMTADAQPPSPPWDYSLYHTNDLSEWQRKVGHNAMEIADTQHVPCVSNENTRFSDHDSSEIHAGDAAHAAALLCAGACYHSVHGKDSTLWTDQELACAQAWGFAMQSVPLEFQQGNYHHRTELETWNIIRAYDRKLADGRDYVVTIRS